MRKFIDITEAFKNQPNRNVGSKITVRIPDAVWDLLSREIYEMWELKVSPQELRKNPKVLFWFKQNLEMAWEHFEEDWLESLNLEDLGYTYDRDGDNYENEDFD